MSNLTLYTTTFNCGRNLLSTSYFASHLFSALKSHLPPDLVVLSLQELAPLGYSFLGGSLLAPYFARFGDAVRIAAEEKFGAEVGYETLVVRNVGLTGIMVFVRREVSERVRWVRTAGVGVGVQETGNKGAVGVRIGVEGEGEDDEVMLTFVGAHFAPMEDACERRNRDWRSICEGMVFESDSSKSSMSSTGVSGVESAPLLSTDATPDGGQLHTLFQPATQIFFLGDLNYRTSDTAPSPSAHDTWPQPASSPDDPQHYKHLLKQDQLTRERKANRTLHHLSEAPIAFPPTYKLASAAQKHAAHAASQRSSKDGQTSESSDEDESERVWLWAKHRTPSWCDRILFHPALSPSQITAYTALPIQPTSDHRPVALSCTLPLVPAKEAAKPPFAVRKDWRERRATARRLEIAVGLAAYLGWTWEGEALCLGTVVGLAGGWLVVRALVAGL